MGITVWDSNPVIFESLVTFEDNVGEVRELPENSETKSFPGVPDSFFLRCDMRSCGGSLLENRGSVAVR